MDKYEAGREAFKVARKKTVDTAIQEILGDLDYIVMATPTGQAREDFTSARILIERAKARMAKQRG